MAPSPIPTRITWLRYFRIEAEMTLDALSEASGVSKVALSRIENQRVRPLPKTKRQIAAALNLPTHIVFPPAGNRSPHEVLQGWVLLSIRKREALKSAASAGRKTA
jgi:transcriptional regulator with XRE-family HTH domain